MSSLLPYDNVSHQIEAPCGDCLFKHASTYALTKAVRQMTAAVLSNADMLSQLTCCASLTADMLPNPYHKEGKTCS